MFHCSMYFSSYSFTEALSQLYQVGTIIMPAFTYEETEAQRFTNSFQARKRQSQA